MCNTKDKYGAGVLLAQMYDQLPPAEQKAFAKLTHGKVNEHTKDENTVVDSVVRIPEVAKRIDRTTRTVHSLIKDGVLQAFRAPGRTRAWGVTGDSLKRFVENCSKTGVNEKTKED